LLKKKNKEKDKYLTKQLNNNGKTKHIKNICKLIIRRRKGVRQGNLYIKIK
jgi:hypothetical protein